MSTRPHHNHPPFAPSSHQQMYRVWSPPAVTPTSRKAPPVVPVAVRQPTASERLAADRAKVRARIRRAPGWVGGYACLWGRPGPSGAAIEKFAFGASLHHPDVAVFLNHDVGPFAGLKDGTLQLSTDPRGLWLEAALDRPEEFRLVRDGRAIGLSPFLLTEERQGARVTKARLGEISIIVPPSRPRLCGTWVAVGARALSRRLAELKAHERTHPNSLIGVEGL